jgi:hypothetical protein
MTRARLDGLYLLLLGCLLFVLIGSFMEGTGSNAMGDFKGVYCDARSLLEHRDPYKQAEILRVYQQDAGNRPLSPDELRHALTLNVYLPNMFIFIAPFAILPWGTAHLLWMILIAASYLFAAFLMWDIGASRAPVASGALVAFCVVNSPLQLFTTGNPAGIVVSLCVVAVWCFLKERFIPAGIICLAVGLAIKPHDAGLVWLFFLLAGGIYRKRAVQIFVLTAVLALPSILWVSQVAPQWMQELHSNLITISAHGSMNDPGPSPASNRTAGMVIDLQSVVSVFRDDPRIYNPIAYLICGVPLLVWLVVTLRSHFSPAGAWLALAAVVPLTMLVTYHRPQDAKLLLLTVPACAMLWAEGGLIGWLALLVDTIGIAMTGDFPLALLVGLTNNLHPDITTFSGQMQYIALLRPVPLILLAMSVFYLWIYVLRCSGQASSGAILARCSEAINAGESSA